MKKREIYLILFMAMICLIIAVYAVDLYSAQHNDPVKIPNPSIAGVQATSIVKSGTITALKFNKNDWATIKKDMFNKYGTPYIQVINKDHESYMWRSTKSVIRLTSYAGNQHFTVSLE